MSILYRILAIFCIVFGSVMAFSTESNSPQYAKACMVIIVGFIFNIRGDTVEILSLIKEKK